MLQSKLSDGDPNDNTINPTGINIQRELNRLEELILEGFRVPLIGRTLVDEDILLEQLDLIRLSLPSMFEEAAAVVAKKEEMLLEVEEYVQQIMEATLAKRAEMLAESDIIKEVEQEAEQMRWRVQQECEAMMQVTLAEIERKRRNCDLELEERRRTAITQAEEIENAADQYADRVLEGIEQDFKDMLRIISNGRRQLRVKDITDGGTNFDHQNTL